MPTKAHEHLIPAFRNNVFRYIGTNVTEISEFIGVILTLKTVDRVVVARNVIFSVSSMKPLHRRTE